MKTLSLFLILASSLVFGQSVILEPGTSVELKPDSVTKVTCSKVSIPKSCEIVRNGYCNYIGSVYHLRINGIAYDMGCYTLSEVRTLFETLSLTGQCS